MTTGAGGDSPYAVLDKLVPGYYHRRTEQGDVCASCCCNNTATENLMAERLVIDDITHWARTYKVWLCPADFSHHNPSLVLQAVQHYTGMKVDTWQSQIHWQMTENAGCDGWVECRWMDSALTSWDT